MAPLCDLLLFPNTDHLQQVGDSVRSCTCMAIKQNG